MAKQEHFIFVTLLILDKFHFWSSKDDHMKENYVQ